MGYHPDTPTPGNDARQRMIAALGAETARAAREA